MVEFDKKQKNSKKIHATLYFKIYIILIKYILDLVVKLDHILLNSQNKKIIQYIYYIQIHDII